MAFVSKDRVRETSTTTGTSDFDLSATSDYQQFSDVMSHGDTCWYAAVYGAEWEVGIGTKNTVVSPAADQLQRTTILASSNGGSKVAFSAGVKDIFMTIPAKAQTAPTIQKFTSGSGTYTTPAGVRWLEVRMVGGGAGGQGSGTTGGGTGTSGGDTTFGTSLLTATGGANSMGAGGTGTISSPAYGQTVAGGRGTGWTGNTPSGLQAAGGSGGNSIFGGGGGGGYGASAGTDAAANSGSGGGGGGSSSTASNYSGGGGSAGGGIIAIIPNPDASYSYSIGAGGSGGAAGSNGFAGGAGGAGYIMVIEHYN